MKMKRFEENKLIINYSNFFKLVTTKRVKFFETHLPPRNQICLLLLVAICHGIRTVNASYVDNVVRYCIIKEKNFSATESQYAEQGPPNPDIPILAPPPFVEEQQIQAYQLELSQRNFECIADTLNVFSDQILQLSRKYRSLVRQCKSIQPTIPKCDASYPYRLINGTCNNLHHPTWGSTFACFQRLWPANYEGVSGFRRSVIGKEPLPNARHISRELIKPDFKPTIDYNSLFAFFGQVVAHDIAQFPATFINGSKGIECCKNAEGYNQHPQCAPIVLHPSDTFYYSKNVYCFNFERIIPCDTCSVEKRVPINYLTGWIDLSLVYGQTDARAQKLRRNDGSGKMKTQNKRFGELMSPIPNAPIRCGDVSKQQYCFASGDTRTNQQLPLVSFETLLYREHNRIAGILKTINPHWDEEKLYQEARRIHIAEFQTIVYNEYLPVLLGPKLTSAYGLNIGSKGYYDSTIDTSLFVEFNAAAFRVHSILPGQIGSGEDVTLLRYLFLNALPFYQDQFAKYLDIMANSPAEKYDSYMPEDFTQFTYKTLRGAWGFDLPALDIQRGRDVGLPTYAEVIEYIENRPGTINTFEHLRNYTIPECLPIIRKIYAHVRDVDFFVGILCERIPSGMIMSPTAAHIVAKQFRNLKYGDRFNVEYDHTLNDEQRNELLGASMARLICDNSKVNFIQPMVFLFPSFKNTPQMCSSIRGVNLEKWREWI